MANTFLTASVVANEALMVLLNNLTMANLVHRDYSKEFVNVGDTITVRRPASFVAKNFTGTTSYQDLTEGSATVKMDRFRDVSTSVTSKEMALSIQDFSTQFITPAMQAIGQGVDSDLVAVALQKASFTITGDDTATYPLDLASASKQMDINKVPAINRYSVLSPTHKYRYVKGTVSNAAYSGSVDGLREAALGRLYGLDTFMDQNCPSIGNTGTATGYKITATVGESKVSLSSIAGTTPTVKSGDSFIVDGYMYTFTADATIADAAASDVAIDQPIHKTLSAVDAVIISGANSAVFHRNGLALVTRNLEEPRGAVDAAIASADGIGVRVVFSYDIDTKKDKVSIDTIYGIKELNTSMIGKIVG